MQQVLRILFECFDLLLSYGFFVSNDILLALVILQFILLMLKRLLCTLQVLLSGCISLNHFSVEAALLLLVDHVIGIVVDVLMLFDLFGVVDYYIGLEVEFRGVQLYILGLLHGLLILLFDLILKVVVYWMMKEILPLDPLVWIYSQHSFQDVLCHFRDVVDLPWKFQRFVLDIVHKIDHICSLIGRSNISKYLRPKQHFIKDHTYRPNICFAIVLSSAQHFRSHIERRSKHSFRKLFVGEQFGEAKISDFDFPVMDEYISQFKIPMHDLVFDQSFEGINNLYEKLDGLLFRDGFILFHILRKISFVAVLQDKVEVVGCLLDIVQLDDVLIVARAQYLDLVLQKLQKFACITATLPLMFSRLMALMAISELSTLLQPLKTSPYCPEPIFLSKTQLSTTLGMNLMNYTVDNKRSQLTILQMQEQQQANYYDKLLHHLNKTFLMNVRVQGLFLDLNKENKRIRFKSIRNIYNIFTEGKADEVIYQKDKPSLVNDHAYNQQFTQRTCWRIVQKLICKISFYLMNEKPLKDIAPSIIKMIALTRAASEKLNNKISFLSFFYEAVDSIIAQNNILEEKIYQLLINKGYISSIDEFYRMNRFEGPNVDFVYSNHKSKVEMGPNCNAENEAQSYSMSKKDRSKRVGFSSKKFNKNFQQKQSIDSVNPHEQVESDQKQQTDTCYLEQDQHSQVSNEQDFKEEEQFNRISYNIHNQVDKTVEQLLNNRQFQLFMRSNAQEQYFAKDDTQNNASTHKKNPLKQILKNLQMRNFKANEKLLIMNDSSMDSKYDGQRKNSTKKMNKMKTVNSNGKSRPSIAMTLSKRMKQKIFKYEHVKDIEDMVVQNLGKLEKQGRMENQLLSINKKHLRAQPRVKTQIFESPDTVTPHKYDRRPSNIQFLSNAFIFKNTRFLRNKMERRISNFSPNLQEKCSSNTIQSVASKNYSSFQRLNLDKDVTRLGHKNKKTKENHVASRFGDEEQIEGTKQVQKQPDQGGNTIKKKNYANAFKLNNNFNPAILKIAAKKYNKTVTEGSQGMVELKIINEAFKDIDFVKFLKSRTKQLTFYKSAESKTSESKFQHTKKYEVYDTVLRRVI